MLAEMATSIAAAECLTFAAAEAMDRGRAVSRLASQAKLYAGESAVFCAERGVQIHGGYGFIKDYRAEKYFRDSKICTIGEGTSEIQRLVIARQLLSREARPPSVQQEVPRLATGGAAADVGPPPATRELTATREPAASTR